MMGVGACRRFSGRFDGDRGDYNGPHRARDEDTASGDWRTQSSGLIWSSLAWSSKGMAPVRIHPLRSGGLGNSPPVQSPYFPLKYMRRRLSSQGPERHVATGGVKR